MRETALKNYAGTDLSLKESSVGVADAKSKVVREVKVASKPEAEVGDICPRPVGYGLRPPPGSHDFPGAETGLRRSAFKSALFRHLSQWPIYSG
jgi:hypothetical protein